MRKFQVILQGSSVTDCEEWFDEIGFIRSDQPTKIISTGETTICVVIFAFHGFENIENLLKSLMAASPDRIIHAAEIIGDGTASPDLVVIS